MDPLDTLPQRSLGSLGSAASTARVTQMCRSPVYISADEKFIKGGFFTEEEALMHPNANAAIAKRDADVFTAVHGGREF